MNGRNQDMDVYVGDRIECLLDDTCDTDEDATVIYLTCEQAGLGKRP